MDALKNEWFSSSRHTKPPPSKMDVLPETFLQIILAVKQLVRNSSASPANHRAIIWDRPTKKFKLRSSSPIISFFCCIAARCLDMKMGWLCEFVWICQEISITLFSTILYCWRFLEDCTIHFLTVHVSRPLGKYAVVYVFRGPGGHCSGSGRGRSIHPG